jgi:transglutaminase 1
MNNWVNALTVLPGGNLIVGGEFTSAGGVAANRIARYNPTTNTWSPLGSGVSGGPFPNVYALAVLPGGDVMAGGFFDTAGGVPARNIARYSPVIDLRQIDSLDTINELAHSTARYALNQPGGSFEQRTILRRGSKPGPGGGTADFDVVVGECFNPQQHVLSFEAQHTFNGLPPLAPVVRDIPLSSQTVPAGQWGCVLREPLTPPVNGERIAKMRVFIPASGPLAAAVGEYTFRAVIKSPVGTRLDEMTFDRPVMILFNPWDPEDEAFMASASNRVEYVLNDRGALWTGTARENNPFIWDYAQFSNDVFLGSLGLLEGLTEAQRSSPATVARWLTEKLDSFDGGVLVGNWSGNYSGGREPEFWKSSQPIFSQYRASGPVKFGQCWVYAGLLTSSLRTFGIPARPVTNFVSGHDKNSNGVLEICRYFDFLSLRWRNSGDSLWNFHVWCEAWMYRSDLSGHDGWQVVDATPQERSGGPSGLYQLGPTPVSAILAGTPQPFDGAFVRSEVDADVQYEERFFGNCSNPTLITTLVGRRITTKAVGSFAAEDVTDKYKVPETTPDPRDVSDVTVLAPDSVSLGANLPAEILVRNLSGEQKDFTVYVLVRSVAQNGDELGVIFGPRTDPITLAAGAEASVAVDVPWSEIAPQVRGREFVDVDVVVTRVDDERRWFVTHTVVVRGLPISIALNPAGPVQELANVEATVTCLNPLAEPIAAGTLTLFGGSSLPIGGTLRSEEIPVPALAPGETFTLTRTLAAIERGEQSLSASWFVSGVVPGQTMAVLTVLPPCPADITNTDGDLPGVPDGAIDNGDFQAFFAAFFMPESDPLRLAADIANTDGETVLTGGGPDGAIDNGDFNAFFAAFFGGCP